MYDVITPGCLEYEVSRLQWNRINELYPAAIAYCSTEKEVKKAILYARRHCMCIRIRGGGHNYVGASSGNGVLIIDVSNMNKIKIHHSCNTVTIQGGAVLGQIYSLLGAKGYPFPGGSCAAVGISGVVSGGGWGYSSRYLGLACDSLVEARLIDDRGCMLTASVGTNPELFWAIRGGGGGNFGVITSLTFSLPEKVSLVTYFTITYENPSTEGQVQFLDAWQNWIEAAPNSVNMKGSIIHSVEEGIQIRCTGLYYGTPDQLQGILSVFAQIPGYQMTYEMVSFLQAFQIITSVYPVYEYMIPYGRFVSAKYSTETLLNLVNRINGPLPLGSRLIELSVYGLGGKVKELAPYDTAFFYRESNYILLIETLFDNNSVLEVNQRWVEQNASYIYGITKGSYINFPYLQLPNYMMDYYGENMECLEMIKCSYDPHNLFNFPQSIQ